MSNEESGSLLPLSKWFEQIFYLALLLWLGVLLAEAFSWGRKDKLLPLSVGIATGIVLVIHILSIRYPNLFRRLMPEIEDISEERIPSDSRSSRSRAEKQHEALLMTTWIIIAGILSYLLGFNLGLLIWVFFVSLHLLKSLRQAIVVTILFEILFYGIFRIIIEMPLWDGIVSLPF